MFECSVRLIVVNDVQLEKKNTYIYNIDLKKMMNEVTDCFN